METKQLKALLKRSEEILSTKADYFAALPKTSYEKSLIETFIDEVSKDGHKMTEEEQKLAKKMLKIAKSYHEFGSGQALAPQYLRDERYDAVLAAYLRSGKKKDRPDEPSAIIPSGIEKVAVVHEDLANNMDKAYIIRKDDMIPVGVAEKDSIEEFFKRAGDKETKLEVLVRPKLDGVSLAVETKKDGTIKKATSRGDNDEGLRIKGLEGKVICAVDKSPAQYELYVSNSDLDDLNRDRSTGYKSNRSAASGIMTRLAQHEDEALSEKLFNHCSFYPIDFIDDEMTSKERFRYIERNFGAKTKVPMGQIIKGNRKEILNKIEDLWAEVCRDRSKYGYDVDGIVITILNPSIQKEMGRSKNKNKFQIAMKFPPVSEKGQIKSIYLDTGNLGRRTHKVLLMAPVTIGGHEYITAKFASIKDLNRDFHVGDECKFARVGDAIPTIVFDDSCKKGTGPKIEIPKKCPCPGCDADLEVIDGNYKCVNDFCIGNHSGLVLNFIEKIGLDGYGPEFVDSIISMMHAGIDGLVGLWNLTPKDLQDRGIGKKTSEKFPEDFRDAIKKLKDYELLGALGFPGIGKSNARKILSVAPLDELANTTQSAIYYYLSKVDGLGESTIKKFLSGYERGKNAIAFYKDRIDSERTDFGNSIVVGTTGLSAEDKAKVRTICNNNKGLVETDGKKFDIVVAYKHDVDTDKGEKARKKEKNSGKKVILTLEEFEAKYK